MGRGGRRRSTGEGRTAGAASSLGWWAVVMLVVGCGGKSAVPREAEPAAVPPATHGRSDDDREAEPAAGPSASVDRGLRFRDPAWFRREMFEGAEVVDFARSKRDADGRFKSHLLFRLPEGVTLAECARLVRAEVSADVGELSVVTEDDGRVRLTGKTPRYRFGAICGEAEGRVRAYVGFEWTS